ncbi:hypothetical protein H4R20_001064 [Coemansia guatemalensis]|uniref:Cation efflux protein transmembrane domain-containing protein n=1 Tax=Coemansia guatemalensis TaxID=2761395 RepID=A0A9W8HXR2_9FUNG|nr:hypothetical protein H4R20_001064 [Coemansia guatemalensis]
MGLESSEQVSQKQPTQMEPPTPPPKAAQNETLAVSPNSAKTARPPADSPSADVHQANDLSFASANPAAGSPLVTTTGPSYGAISTTAEHADQATTEADEVRSGSTGKVPCSRCRRISSGMYGSSASSITRAEAELVPKFIAAQVSDAELRQISQQQGPNVAAYYEAQNGLISEMLEVNQQHTDDTLETQSEQRRQRQHQVDRAVRVSVVVNVLVVIAQLYAAVSSESLALFATMSEASMDLLSSIILLLASMAARGSDRFSLYPTGRFKLETIGVIVFAVLMGTFSVALLVESVAALLSTAGSPNKLSLYDSACVVAALVAKVGLYWYCYTLREYHAAHVLMIDHRNDVMVNAFGLFMAIAGKHMAHWMDPLGSLLIALLILRSWMHEAWGQIKLIIGIRADPRLLQVLTFAALTHDPRIEKVDRVVAYHSGAKLFVEVDIVMPPSTPLFIIHDVAESLQEKYEHMPGIGRCYVHVDYEATHRPEHQNAVA